MESFSPDSFEQDYPLISDTLQYVGSKWSIHEQYEKGVLERSRSLIRLMGYGDSLEVLLDEVYYLTSLGKVFEAYDPLDDHVAVLSVEKNNAIDDFKLDITLTETGYTVLFQRAHLGAPVHKTMPGLRVNDHPVSERKLQADESLRQDIAILISLIECSTSPGVDYS